MSSQQWVVYRYSNRPAKIRDCGIAIVEGSKKQAAEFCRRRPGTSFMAPPRPDGLGELRLPYYLLSGEPQFTDKG